MPEINQVSNLLPASTTQQIPPDVKAKLLAAQLAQQQAAAPKAPYTSRTAGLLTALEGGLGGLLEGTTLQNEMQAQAAHRQAVAKMLLSTSPGAMGAAGGPGAGGAPTTSPTTPDAAPAGQGGIGSDRVASKSHSDFIASIMPEAQRVGAQLGVDPRLIAGQAALESNFGKSAPGGNLFGIKGAGTGPISTMESVNGQMVPTKASFAAYDSPTAAFDGYGKLISGPRYAGLRNAQGLDAQLDALGKSGYATDPNYAAKVGAIARGIQVPGAGQGSGQGATTASADMPAPNAQPVASSTLPPGVTPADFDQPAPPSDGTVRGDLLAAAAQHGMGTLVPNVSGPVTASGVPHQLAPGAGARADSGVGAGIGGGPSNTPIPTPAADAVPFDPEGTGAGNYDPSAAPLMGTSGTALANAIENFKPPLGQTQAAVVPPPVTAATPDAPPPPSILPPAQPPSGLGTAGAPVVPPPQGDLTAPSPAPAPDPIAAGQMAGQDVAMDPVVPDPQGTMAPPAPSSPNGTLAGPQSDAAMGNDVDPSSLRGAIMAAMGSGAGTSGPQSDAAAPLAPSTAPAPQVDVDQNAGPAPIAALGATPDAPQEPSLRDTLMAAMGGGGSGAPAAPNPPTGPGPGPTPSAAPVASGPGVAPLPGPALAQPTAAPTPSPTSSPSPAALAQGAADYRPSSGDGSPGSGAMLPTTAPMPPSRPSMLADALSGGLPATGPTPPPGAQSRALAQALQPDAPAPNAVPTGPAPVTPGSPLANALDSYGKQPLGLAGDGGADPSSARAFLTAQALDGKPAGGPAAPPSAQSGPAPGGLMSGITSLLNGGGSSSGQGGAAPAPAPAGSPPSAAPQGGASGYPAGSQQAALYALATDPRTSPQEMEMIMARLNPAPMKIAAGEGLVGRRPDGTWGELYSQPSKDQYAYSPDGVHILNRGTGQVTTPGGAGNASGGWRSMSTAERQQYGVTDGRPAFVAPNGEPHFGMPETQGQGETAEAKSAGEAAATRRNDMITGAMAAPEKIARLKLLGTVLDNTQTGPLAPEVGNAAAIAQRLGISNDRLSTLGIDPNSPVNNAIANKLAGEMTMGSIGAKNGGMPASNFSVAERQFIEALYPNIENQAGGNRAVTDVLTAVEQRKMQVADAWSAYKDQQSAAGKPLSYENFEDSFRRAHSQDNIFAPIIQKYQAGGYTPTAPTPGGVPGAPSAGQGQGAPSMMQQPAPASAPAPAAAGQGQGGGGYLPGAARGAPAPAPGGGGQAAPPAAPRGQGSDPLSQARAAIAAGAPRAAVIQRLQGMGINAAGL